MSAKISDIRRLNEIIKVLTVGSLIDDVTIQTVCAKSLNYMVANRLVYKDYEPGNPRMS